MSESDAVGVNVDPLAPSHHLRVLGRLASPQSVDLRDLLTRNGVDYLWLDVDSDPLVRYLGVTSLDGRSLPVCVFPDGTVLEAPTRLEVASRVGLHTRPEHDVYDLTIIGGGPAGLTAAVYGASEGLRTLLLERDAPGEERFYEGCDVCIVGGGNSAGQAALNLSRLARSVTIAVRADSLAKGMSHYLVERLESTPNVAVHVSSEVVLAEGEDRLERICIQGRDPGAETTVAVDALFVLIGGQPQGDYAPSIRRDSRGFMLTGPDLMNEPGFADRWPLDRAPYFLETSWSGLLAAGDIRSGAIKRVASAVGEGAMAVQLVHHVPSRTSNR